MGFATLSASSYLYRGPIFGSTESNEVKPPNGHYLAVELVGHPGSVMLAPAAVLKLEFQDGGIIVGDGYLLSLEYRVTVQGDFQGAEILAFTLKADGDYCRSWSQLQLYQPGSWGVEIPAEQRRFSLTYSPSESLYLHTQKRFLDERS